MALDLDRLIALEAKATKGPWKRNDYADWAIQPWPHVPPNARSLQDVAILRRNDDWCGDDDEQDASLDLIVEMRNQLPALIAAAQELARLRALLAKVRFPVEQMNVTGLQNEERYAQAQLNVWKALADAGETKGANDGRNS